MSDLAKRVLDTITEAREVTNLRWSDRGRLAAIETPAALFVGTLGTIIFHQSGKVTLYVEREGFKTDVTVGQGTTVWFGESEPATEGGTP